MSETNETARELSKDQVGRGFALVRNARAALSALPERKISDKTQKKYQSLFASMVQGKQRPEQIAGTRRSYYVYRAALNYVVPGLIRERLQAADRAFKAKAGADWWSHILMLRRLLGLLQEYSPDPERGNLTQRARSQIPVPRGISQSKRGGLKKLPDNWRDIFWQSVPENSVYRAAIALSILTGVRPAELVSGVKVANGECNTLVVTIRGAKTQGGKYGQVARQLTIACETPMAGFLRREIGTTTSMVIKIRDARLFGNQVSAYSKKCWPGRQAKISPYSFRHQFAADLKAVGDPDTVSLALGHAVADTAQHYGTARQARGGGARVLAVATTRELRKERKLAKTIQLGRLNQRARQK